MGIVPVQVMGYDWEEFCNELTDMGIYEDPALAIAPYVVKGVGCSSTGWGDGQYEVVVDFDEDDKPVRFACFFDDEEELGY
jgi:hypothetical protein